LKKPWNISGFKLTGPFDRFVIFLGSLSLGSFVSHYLLSFKSFQSLESSFSQFFDPIAQAFGLPSEALSYLPMIFVTSQVIVFFSTLVFGRSLFEMVAGVRNSGPWWWQRIGGASKAIFDIAIGMFFIFDLPILVKKATLKERMVGSYSLVSKKALSIRSLFIIPFFILLTLFAPLMTNLEFLEGHPVTQMKVEADKLGNTSDFSEFKEVSSELFHFKSFTSMGEGKLWPLPDYDRIRARKKKKISPTLVIYDAKNKTSGHWRLKKQISLLKLLSLGRKGNPLFSVHFPHLNGAIELMKQDPQAFAKKEGISLERFDDLFTPEVKREIEVFFKASFELGSDKLVGHTLTYGPFLRGFIEVRQAVLGLLPKGSKAEVDLIELGNHNFLRFRQKHEKGSILGKSYTESYLPIGTEHAGLFEIGWDSDLSGALGAKHFRESVLSRAQWYFDYKNIFKSRIKNALNEVTKSSALVILDLLIERELSKEDQSLLEKLLYRYYFDICRKAIKNSDADLIELIKDNFGRLSSFIEYKNSLSKDGGGAFFSATFTKNWKSLWDGFRLQKDDFFTEENSKLK